MDVSQRIEIFDNFLKQDDFTQGKGFLEIDYNKFNEFNAELAHLILVDPEKTIGSAEIAAEKRLNASTYVRFKDIPDICGMSIGNIRTIHIGRIIKIAAVIKSKSDIRPLVIKTKHECPSCGNIIATIQTGEKIKEPTKCGCGRKHKFKILNKDMVDSQKIIVRDKTNKRLQVFLKADLVDRKVGIGGRYIITGTLRELPVMIGKSQSTTLDLILDANNIENFNAKP